MHEGESGVAQSCPTLSDPMDCSPPGSSVHGIFQARVLEWVAIAFSILEKSRGQLLISPERMKLLDQSENDAQLCLTLCDPIGGSLPGSAVPGILQARTLEWVAIAFSRNLLLM